MLNIIYVYRRYGASGYVMSFDTQFTDYLMHKTTRHNMQEDVSLQKHRCGNFKPDAVYTCY
jgi:hypothetical protein